MQQAFTLDGIVTVVDVRHIVRHLEECEEARAQIVFADVLILNKLDLIEEAAVAPLEQRLRRINALAQVYRSTHTAVPIAPLLRLGGFDIERARLVNPTLLPAETRQSWEALDEYSHNDDIRSVSLEMEGALNPLLVRAWPPCCCSNMGWICFVPRASYIWLTVTSGSYFRVCICYLTASPGGPGAQTTASIVWSLSGATWIARC